MSQSDTNVCFIAMGNDEYEPTEHTGGAWRDDEQHLAPVAGLVVHHMEQWAERNGLGHLSFSRFSLDVLGQIHRQRVSLHTEVLRPGRTIELVETIAEIDGRAVIRARGWLLQTSDTSEVSGNQFEPMPCGPDEAQADAFGAWPGGFIRSMRAVRCDAAQPGRGRTWVTSDLDLVQGERASEVAEFLKVIDTANGTAPLAVPGEWAFPNVDLTIHLFRAPRGRWAGFDTRVAFGSQGIGLTSSVIHDVDGPVGVVQQSLTVRSSLA